MKAKTPENFQDLFGDQNAFQAKYFQTEHDQSHVVISALLFFVEHDRASTRLNNNDGEILVVEATVDFFYLLPRIDVHAFDKGCENEIEW